MPNLPQSGLGLPKCNFKKAQTITKSSHIVSSSPMLAIFSIFPFSVMFSTSGLTNSLGAVNGGGKSPED